MTGLQNATSCICIGVLASLALVTVRAFSVYNAVCMIDAVDIDDSIGVISALRVSNTINIIYAGSVCDVASMISAIIASTAVGIYLY